MGVAGCSDMACRPHAVDQSEAVESAACNWEAEADCNIEGERSQSNSGARRWRFSSPDNWSWLCSLSECSQPRTASRKAPPSSSLQF